MEMPTENLSKFDTFDYAFECINCDEVFKNENIAKAHVEWHKEIFKNNKINNPTGLWGKLGQLHEDTPNR